MIEIGSRVKVIRVNPKSWKSDAIWSSIHGHEGVVIALEYGCEQPYKVIMKDNDSTTSLWCSDVMEMVVLPKELFEI